MSGLSDAFDERLEEIDAYLALLQTLEKQVIDGPPRITIAGPTISVQQVRILYSNAYLQLYNLIEATVTFCLDALARAIVSGAKWTASDLSQPILHEWARAFTRVDLEHNVENRLRRLKNVVDHLVAEEPVSAFKFEKGAGGSWDDQSISKVCERLGLELKLSRKVEIQVKRHFRDDMGALAYIKELRNALAHGTTSFEESGNGVAVSDLLRLREATVSFLREVVNAFERAIDRNEFLTPHRRPNTT